MSGFSPYTSFPHPGVSASNEEERRRESANLDSQNRVSNLARELSTFALETITSADGREYEVLARQLGESSAPSAPWDLIISGNTVGVAPGFVTDGDAVNISDITATTSIDELQPNDCIYLESTGDVDLLAERITSLQLKYGKWTDFPERYTFSEGEEVELLTVIYPLWQFVSDATAELTPVGDLFAKSQLAGQNLTMINAFDNIDGTVYSLPVAIGGGVDVTS